MQHGKYYVMYRGEPKLKKSVFEIFIEDYSLPEKMVAILWFGMPYLIWMIADGLEVWYRVLISIGIFILLTLLCYWFGKFMSSGDRDWNY